MRCVAPGARAPARLSLACALATLSWLGCGASRATPASLPSPSPSAASSARTAAPLVAPRATPPSPLTEALPSEFAPDDRAFTEALACPLGGSRDLTVDEAAGVAATFVRLEPGCVARLARSDIDAVGVVLASRVDLSVSGPAPGAATLRPWGAFAVHERAFELRASASGPAVVYVVTARGPAPTQRPAGWSTRDLSLQRDVTWGHGAMRARFYDELAPATPRVSIEVLFASRDAIVPEHTHPGAWELLAPLRASGRFHARVRRPDGRVVPEAHAVSPGRVQLVAPDVPHAWEPDGTSSLLALQAYSPPGPELRFLSLAGVTPQRAAGSADAAP